MQNRFLRYGVPVFVFAAVVALAALATAADDPGEPWVAAMREVHQRFAGRPRTFAQFGDSITVTMAFWAPLSSNPPGLTKELSDDLKLVKEYQRPECWRDWKGSEFGSNGGMTIRWADENVAAWLKKVNPEVVVILFGTNDLSHVPREEYEAKTRVVARRCLDHGAIPLLTTIPPRHGLEERAAQFADTVRKIARELKTPLVDYHAEILKRRPDDWDGALDKFRDAPGDEYNVPTLVARDGVHPSNPRDFQDYSDRSQSHNGYVLRNALTLAKYAEVIRKVLRPE